MLQTATAYLDADELLHLALTASRQGRTEEAIIGLKRALALAPDSARLHYVLGSEYAQIGLLDRAVAHIHQAIELNPTLEGPRFQLGFIYLNAGNVDAATKTWEAFDALGEDHALYLFKTGLLHLVKNDLGQCEECLRRGIAANNMYEALSHDMAQILKGVQNRRAATARPATKQEPPPPKETTAKPDAPPTPATPATAPPKRDAATPKPAAPKAAVLAAYRQNAQEGKES